MRSNYIWLGLVPAVAKVMQSVDDKVAVNFGGNNIVISTQLPFSWQLFYWGAIAFVLAHFAYIALCPALIRDHRDFQEYINRGYISSHIADIYKKTTGEKFDLNNSFGTNIERVSNFGDVHSLSADEQKLIYGVMTCPNEVVRFQS